MVSFYKNITNTISSNYECPVNEAVGSLRLCNGIKHMLVCKKLAFNNILITNDFISYSYINLVVSNAKVFQ